MIARSRTTNLTRGEIARAALAMVDHDGIERFSMRRLAEALDVTPMAVYHHFENRAEVLQAAGDQVWIEAALGVEDVDDPVEDLVQAFLVVRRTFRNHVGVTTFAFASPSTEEAVHATAFAITRRFENAGFRDADVGIAYHVLATYTLGSALLEAERTILDRSIRHPVSDLGQLAPGDLGVDARSEAAYLSVRSAMDADPTLERFERGLREITVGLVASFVPRARA